MLNKDEYEKALNDFYAFAIHEHRSIFFKEKYELLDQLIKEYFKLVECAKKLQDDVDYYKHEYFAMCDLIEKPQAYKFKELHVNMWVWDDKIEMFILITFINKQFKKMHVCLTEYDGFNDEYVNVEYTEYFEEGRFFPITKALEYQE